MSLDNRFDELVAGLGGFYRTWFVYLGLELGLLAAIRTGTPMRQRPDRYRVAIERLTVQDIAVFFQEGLAALPNIVPALRLGSRILDIHCGGGRWLIAMAQRFPGTRLTGIEFEEDSVARARANVAAASLADRIEIQHGHVTGDVREGTFDLAYFQYALHQLPDPVAALQATWRALRPDGRLLVMDWYLPSEPDELRSQHGQLIAGVQLDELFGGLGLVRRTQALEWFHSAGLPSPELIDLPSGATLITAARG